MSSPHDYSPVSGPGSPSGKIPVYHNYDREHGRSPSHLRDHPHHPSHDLSPNHRDHPSHHHSPSHQGHHQHGNSYQARQVACICCAVAVIALVLLCLSLLHIIGPPSAFDCQQGYANWKVGWSDMKKEYCCENEGLGCMGNEPGNGEGTGGEEKPPFWLGWWLADMSLGLKFMLSGMLALLIGCCCGAFCYLQHLKREIAERRSQTEHELIHELTKTLARCGAKSGEIAVTLMWDTKDDLDLHVKLPGKYGEISAENPEVSGGRLDIDGNKMLATAATKPIENIYWPRYDHTCNHHPPIGEYSVYVKVYQKHTHHCHDVANLTVVVTVQEHKDIYHVRMLPGCTELKVCTFHYDGPVDPHHLQHQEPRSGGGSPDSGHRRSNDHGRR